jgi:probable F420-dependent oxidoreductase
MLEAMTALTYVASSTSTIHLGVGVLIAGYRPALLLAKQAASLDHLSGGRLELGLGVGWLREEFAALGVAFEERSARLVETVQVIRACWASDTPEFHGRFCDFGPVFFGPRPPAPLPIWFGASVEAALVRTAELADGWLGSSHLTPEEAGAAIAFMRRRRPAGLAPLRGNVYGNQDPANPSAVFERFHRLSEVGCDQVLADSDDQTPDGVLRLIATFDRF